MDSYGAACGWIKKTTYPGVKIVASEHDVMFIGYKKGKANITQGLKAQNGD